VELLENPLELRQAVGLAALIALVFLLVAAVRVWLGDAGVYVLAALSGFMDVDAVTLTLAQQARGDLAPATAVRAILLAALVNDLVKGVLTLAVGGRRLARLVFPILAATSALTLGLLLCPF
jgi:Predicted membrane protein